MLLDTLANYLYHTEKAPRAYKTYKLGKKMAGGASRHWPYVPADFTATVLGTGTVEIPL